MKPAGLSLLCLAVPGLLVAQAVAPAMPEKTSSRLTQEIRAHLPPYAPPGPQPAGTANPTSSDPELLQLPKFTVKEKRVPTSDPDVWLTGKVIQHKAMAAYQGSMTPLEWALNSWFVPLFSAPASVRARAAYQEKKLAAEYSQLAHIANVGRLADSESAGKSEKALKDAQQADDWQSRPAGN
ncbi:MAG: hypothetical protein JWQ83_1422 [Lacunisphaera sp.]|nr:hypothetical protein [Lacunisphaera sp.]MDB6166282.1 hypothetical protein [Lacunisphaera sp.]